MVKLSEEMISEFKAMKTIYLATASAKGIPNVVPIGAMFLQDAENLWVIDNFMKKTLSNLKENPWASFCIWTPEGKMSWQIKCKASVEDSGEDYVKARDMMHAKKPELPAKGLVKLKFTEIYQVKPGPGAGDLIAD